MATAGNVKATQNSEYLISTGDNSPALVVQSVGGGGGVAMVTGDVTMGATGSGTTNGNVEVINQSIIETYGANSTGLLVQSVGGGGGFMEYHQITSYLGVNKRK